MEKLGEPGPSRERERGDCQGIVTSGQWIVIGVVELFFWNGHVFFVPSLSPRN